MDDKITPFDWERMLFGDAPTAFLLEIGFRTVVMYAAALLIIRLMGKRGMGQLSPFDYVIVIALGTAVGDPMLYPKVGLIQSLIILAVVVSLQTLFANWSSKNDAVDHFLGGKPEEIIDGGVIVREIYDEQNLSHDGLFGSLRSQGVHHLGQIKKAYIEQSGKMSVFMAPPAEVKPGLIISPLKAELERAAIPPGASAPETATYACTECGETVRQQEGQTMPPCPRYGKGHWLRAREPSETWAAN